MLFRSIVLYPISYRSAPLVGPAVFPCSAGKRLPHRTNNRGRRRISDRVNFQSGALNKGGSVNIILRPASLSPLAAWREGHIVAYALALNRWPRNHAVAKTEDDMKALLLDAAAINSEPLSLLLPVRQASLFRWCLDRGFRAVLPMTLMAMDKY